MGIGPGERAAPISLNAAPGTTRHLYADPDTGRAVYGGHFYDIDENGNYVQGTSDAEKDEALYHQLAFEGDVAPQIDRYQELDARNKADEARGLSLQGRNEIMGSLGQLRAGAYGTSRDLRLSRDAAEGTSDDMRLLANAANGNVPSRAEILGQQLRDRALRAQVSAAGSVRGGPGASAAAYRFASQNAQTQAADMNAGIQAGRADELAQARGAYAGARGVARRDYGTLSGAARTAYQSGAQGLRTGDEALREGDLKMRGQDIGLATDQAKLEAGQRIENDANRGRYLGLENATKFGVMAADNGNADAAFNHAQATHAQERADEQADMAKVKDTIGLVGAVGSGGMSGAEAADKYSDVRTKEPVTWGSLAPITWGAPMKAAEEAEKSDDKGRPGDSKADWPSGKSPWTIEAEEPVRDTLGAYDRNAGLYRADPYGSGQVFQGDPSDRDSDIFRGNPYGRKRELTYSDQAAKDRVESDAFQRGVKYAGTKDRSLLPDKIVLPNGEKVEIDQPRYPASEDQTLGRASSNTAQKADPNTNFVKRKKSEEAIGKDAFADALARGVYSGYSGPHPGLAFMEAGKALVGGYTAHQAREDAKPLYPKATLAEAPKATGEANPLTTRGEPTFERAAPEQSETPSREDIAKYLSALPPAEPTQGHYREVRPVTYSDKRAKTSCYSDEDTKKRFGDMPEDSMKDAMRSMEPHPYAYKMEFAARSGQEPGEVNVGPMAQSMAKDPVARTVVGRDPDTGMMTLDKDKMLKLLGGSLAVLQSEIDDLHDGHRARSAGESRRGRAA